MPIVDKARYLAHGLTGRTRVLCCPACGSRSGRRVDRKWFHSLIECDNCGILHRYPAESASRMMEFYDEGYAEPGLTTELPSKDQLGRLVASGFKGSGKDFTYHTEILKSLGLAPGAGCSISVRIGATHPGSSRGPASR